MNISQALDIYDRQIRKKYHQLLRLGLLEQKSEFGLKNKYLYKVGCGKDCFCLLRKKTRLSHFPYCFHVTIDGKAQLYKNRSLYSPEIRPFSPCPFFNLSMLSYSSSIAAELILIYLIHSWSRPHSLQLYVCLINVIFHYSNLLLLFLVPTHVLQRLRSKTYISVQ